MLRSHFVCLLFNIRIKENSVHSKLC